jgi:hypothetical protein
MALFSPDVQPSSAQLNDRFNALTTQLDVNRTEFQEFRQSVVDVALRYAKDNDWCPEVTNALAELGLKDLIPTTTRFVTLTYRVTVEGEFGWDDEAYVNEACDQISYVGELTDSDVSEERSY